jgi:hypothetical protein
MLQSRRALLLVSPLGEGYTRDTGGMCLYPTASFSVNSNERMKTGVFWDVVQCGSCKNRRFGGMYCLYLQGRKISELEEKLKNGVFWDITPYGSRKNRCLGGT